MWVGKEGDIIMKYQEYVGGKGDIILIKHHEY